MGLLWWLWELAKGLCGSTVAVRHWTRVPRLGEAKNPGPNAGFDCEDHDLWSDSDDQPHAGMDLDDQLPPTEQEIALSWLPTP